MIRKILYRTVLIHGYQQPIRTNMRCFVTNFNNGEWPKREVVTEKYHIKAKVTPQTKFEEKVSEEHKTKSLDEIKLTILQNAMQHAKKVGWSKKALQNAARDIGYIENIDKLFPKGAIELVVFARSQWYEGLKKALEEQKTKSGETMTESEWLNFGLRYQLELVIPYKKTWYQAMILGIEPGNITKSMKSLSRVFNLLYKYAGDQSIDFTYYTKRLYLASIYGRAEMFLLFDNSPNHEETWNFLEQQINTLMKEGSLISWAALGTIDVPKVASGMCEAFWNSFKKNMNNK